MVTVATSAEMPAAPGVAIVTGGVRGIGHAIVRSLAGAGMRVASVGLDDESKVETPPNGRYYQCDISDLDGHEQLLQRVASNLGEPTCLVNNAGVTSRTRGDLLDLTVDSYDATFEVNLRAGFFLSQAFSRRCISHAGAQPHSIIFIGSANAEIVGKNRADYCISKAGVAMMAKLFAARLAAHGIAVFEVRPGIIRTQMTVPAAEKYDAFIASGGVPLGRWGEPEDIGQTVAALATGAIPYATGIHIDVGGGLQIHRI